jgi:hypothetical protein
MDFANLDNKDLEILKEDMIENIRIYQITHNQHLNIVLRILKSINKEITRRKNHISRLKDFSKNMSVKKVLEN